MSENKRKKLAAKKAKAKAKKSKIKGVVIVAILAALCGCSSSEPASRLTRGEYGDITVDVREASNITVNLTVGDAAYASADSEGSTETQTANPTNTTDVKPDVDVNTTGGKTAGILESAISAGAALLKGDSTCPAGNCSASCDTGTCEGGVCSTCSDCGDK